MNVLIVCNDFNFCSCLKENFSKSKIIKNIFITNNFDVSSNTENYYDIIVLQITEDEDNIKQILSLNKNASIIGLTSNNKSFLKYLSSPDFLRIYKMPINIIEFLNYIQKQFNIFEESAIKDKNEITENLVSIGFNISHSGTIYLAESIEFALSHGNYQTKSIYEEVGKKHNISAKVIYWAIVNCINSAYKSLNEAKMEDFFKISDKRKPTPKFIIDFFAKAPILW